MRVLFAESGSIAKSQHTEYANLTPSAFSQNMFCISECECEYGFKDAFEHDHENGSCTGM